MLLTTEQTNFASGEIDPTLRGQTTLRAYANGARKVRNCARISTGGLERRRGTYDLAATGGLARMAEFEFSNDQRYVLAFRSGAVRIFDLNGVQLQEITGCPWTADHIFQMTYSQAADVMVIAHQAFRSQVLRRTGATSFALSDFAFEVSIDGGKIYQPHYKFARPEVTLTPSADSGAGITLQASAPIFVAGNVNQRWRLYGAEVTITAVTDSDTAVATVFKKLEGKLDLDPLKSKADTTEIEVLHLFHGLEDGTSITLSGCNQCGFIPGDQIDGTHVVDVVDELTYKITLTGVSYLYDDDGNSGTAPVTRTTAAVSEDGGGSNVSFSVAGTQTRAWSEPAISAVRGWPGACCFHDGRLWFMGTPSQPDACFGSNALQPFRFDVGKGYDGDSVQVASGTEDVSRILHAVSNGELQIFTATRESVFVTRDGEPITPNNARIKGQAASGSGFVQPVIYDGATLFVQENGKSVSEFVYASSEGRFRSTAVSTLASHLIRSPVSVAVSQGEVNRAEPFAYFVNSDGTVAVFHSMRAENIAGWGLWELGAGAVRSACSVGPYVFFCVEVRGSFRLYRLSDDDLGCLDGQVKHVSNTGPRTEWTLDARVRSRVVGIRSELGYHGTMTVPANGAITLPIAVETLVAGDPFFYEIELLPPVVSLPDGTRTGKIKRIVRTIVEFDETYSAVIGSTRIEPGRVGNDRAGPISPVTGSVEVRHLGFARSPVTRITQDEPLPARILSAVQEVKV